MDERLLVEKARQGDEDAFGELVKIYHQQIYSLAYKYVNQADDAKELAQMAWVKAWKKIGTFKGNAKFYTWMYRVAVFVCLDYLRKRKRQSEVTFLDEVDTERRVGTEPAASVQSRPDRQAEQNEVRARFYKILETLSPEHRMALILREVEGHSYDEIAEMMKCRRGTVMSRIYYARQTLQDKMKDLK